MSWWVVVLDVVIALGTIAAVFAALIIASVDRRAADKRAEADRAAMTDRAHDEREYDRRIADARWRLDLLVRLTEVFEQHQALLATSMPAQREYGLLVALVRAYPGALPLMRRAHTGRVLDEEVVEAHRERYDVQPGADRTEELRGELRYRLQEIRREFARGGEIDEYGLS